MTALDVSVAAGFTGADPTLVAHELRAIIEAAIVGHDRSQQTWAGPSQLGTTCTRCLVHALAETPQRREAAWLPTIGTAVHEWLECVMLRHEAGRIAAGATASEWLPEGVVTVGTAGARERTGHTDVFHVPSGTVIDWKLVGTTTMRKVAKQGASALYRAQAQMYGKGWEDAGYTVTACLIYFLPRNGRTLDEARPFLTPYDRAEALASLTRAQQWHDLIAAAGLDVALTAAGPHTGDEFSCDVYPDAPPKRFATPTVDAFLGV